MLKSYDVRMRDKAEALRSWGHARILAVESSCDETAIAVVDDGRIIRALERCSYSGGNRYSSDGGCSLQGSWG